jgi:adenylate cyclase
MNWDLRTWRSNLRLISALVMLSFVICHLTAHCLLLISFESGDAARNILMYPWRTWIGTGLLLTALLVHYANALWSIHLRRSMRLSHWEWAQLSLGLCIPLCEQVVGRGLRRYSYDLNSEGSSMSNMRTSWVYRLTLRRSLKLRP